MDTNHSYVVYIGSSFVPFLSIVRCCLTKESAIDFIAEKMYMFFPKDKQDKNWIREQFTKQFEKPYYSLLYTKVNYYTSDDHVFSKFIGIKEIPFTNE